MKHLYQKHNPARPVDWRITRVLDVARNGKPISRTQDDQVVREAVKFVRDLDAATTEALQDRLFSRNMSLFYAYQLATEPSWADAKFLVEARILARQTNEQIAAKLATLPLTVHWYEQLWFHVRDRLDYSDYILQTVLKQNQVVPGVEELGFTSKLLAYFGGPVVLDHALYGFQLDAQPADFSDLPAYYDRQQMALLRRRALAAAREMEVNRFNCMQLMEIHLRMIELDRQSESGGSRSETLEALDGMLNQLQWTVGESDELAGPLGEYAGAAAELRASEMLDLTYGRTKPARKKRLAEVKTLEMRSLLPSQGSEDHEQTEPG